MKIAIGEFDRRAKEKQLFKNPLAFRRGKYQRNLPNSKPYPAGTLAP